MHAGHAQRPVEEILSTPWPLHLVGVRSAESLWPHTHTHTSRFEEAVLASWPCNRNVFLDVQGESLCIFGVYFSI